jgi:HSP20 family molecular chaperone IbpA
MIIVKRSMIDFPIKEVLGLMNTFLEDPLALSSLLDSKELSKTPSSIIIPAPGISKEEVKVSKSENTLHVYVKDSLARNISIPSSVKAGDIKVKVKDGLITISLKSSKTFEDIPIT